MSKFIDSERWYSIDAGVQQVYRLLEASKERFKASAEEKGKQFWLKSIIENRKVKDPGFVRALEEAGRVLKTSELVLTLQGRVYRFEFPYADITLMTARGDISGINDYVNYETLSLLVCEGEPTIETVTYTEIIKDLIEEKHKIIQIPYMVYRHLRRKKIKLK